MAVDDRDGDDGNLNADLGGETSTAPRRENRGRTEKGWVPLSAGKGASDSTGWRTAFAGLVI